MCKSARRTAMFTLIVLLFVSGSFGNLLPMHPYKKLTTIDRMHHVEIKGMKDGLYGLQNDELNKKVLLDLRHPMSATEIIRTLMEYLNPTKFADIERVTQLTEDLIKIDFLKAKMWAFMSAEKKGGGYKYVMEMRRNDGAVAEVFSYEDPHHPDLIHGIMPDEGGYINSTRKPGYTDIPETNLKSVLETIPGLRRKSLTTSQIKRSFDEYLDKAYGLGTQTYT